MRKLIKSSHAPILVLASLFVLIFVFYLWTVCNGNISVLSGSKYPLEPKEGQGYHVLLADAFLHDQLNLRIDPSPELLALEDPYDPVANDRITLHDASLYKGKYFLYFTPTVALLFIIPFKVIFGYFLSEPLLTALLCFVGFAFTYFTFIRLLTIGALQVSLPTLATSALVFATATTVPFLLRRPAVYELCIAAGFAFMMAGTYFLVQAISSGPKKRIYANAITAGILFGLCISSRPSQLFACGVLIVGFIVIRRFLYSDKTKTLFSYLGLLMVPIGLIGIAMCWYNYARFGSIFEFGTTYELSGLHPHRTALMSLSYLPLGLYHYLFQSIPFDLRFPFFHAATPVSPFRDTLPFKYFYEQIIGLMSLPVYWLFLFPLFCIHQLWKKVPALLILSLFMLAAGLISLCILSTMVCITMRYMVDFSPILLLSIISLFLVSREFIFISNGPGLTLNRQCYYIPAFLSILISLCISMTGYGDNFKNSNPQLYDKLESMFSININSVPSAPKVPPNVPWEKLKDLYIMDIHNPNGIGHDFEGVPCTFFWLGLGETQIRIFSINSGMAHFAAEVYPGPSLPVAQKSHIRITSGNYAQESTINGPQEDFTFSVPVQAGENVVRILSLDQPAELFKLPNGQMQPMLLMFRRLRLVGVNNK